MAADSGIAAFVDLQRGAALLAFALAGHDLRLAAGIVASLKSMASFSVSSTQRAVGAEDGFAVAAEAVAVDRGVLHADLLAAGDGIVRIVTRRGKLEDAEHVVFAVAVGREQRAVAGSDHAQRMLLLGLRMAALCMA